MSVEVSIVGNADELAQCFAVRAAVFMVEQKCPYAEEFDGNDFSATQVIGRVDGEPAGTVRIRYFVDFVKFERICVLERFRTTDLSKRLLEFCVEIVRRKGYRKVYGHAQKRLVRHWKRFGYEPMDKDFKLVFSDHEYTEILGEFPPHPDAITLASNPYIILRREGAWDEPGILDQSAERPPTNPH
jgi:predicted GNAT family N-acyltransferase